MRSGLSCDGNWMGLSLHQWAKSTSSVRRMGGIERNAVKSWDQKRTSWRSWGPGRAGGCACVPLNILLHSQSGIFQTTVLTQRCHPTVWLLILIWGQHLPGENPNSAAFWGLVPQHVTYLRKSSRAMCQRLADQHPAFEIRIHQKKFFCGENLYSQVK